MGFQNGNVRSWNKEPRTKCLNFMVRFSKTLEIEHFFVVPISWTLFFDLGNSFFSVYRHWIPVILTFNVSKPLVLDTCGHQYSFTKTIKQVRKARFKLLWLRGKEISMHAKSVGSNLDKSKVFFFCSGLTSVARVSTKVFKSQIEVVEG